jgi:prolyl oligopeptidase
MVVLSGLGGESPIVLIPLATSYVYHQIEENNMRSIATAIIIVLTSLDSGALALDAALSGPPYAHSEALTEQRFGITYIDPYRWMENADDPALYDWLRAEAVYTNAQTAGHLREQLAIEFKKIFIGEAGERLLVDSRRFEEQMTRRHRFVRELGDGDFDRGLMASSSGRYAIIAEPNNTDIQTVQIKDTRSNLFLKDVLLVKFFDMDVIWDDNETSFVYVSARDGRLGGATSVIRRHRLNTAQSTDTTLLESKNPEEMLSLFKEGSRNWLMRAGGDMNSLSLLNLTTGQEETAFRTRKGNLGWFDYQEGKFWFVSFLKQDLGEVVTFDPVARKFATVVSARDVPLDRAVLVGNDLYLTYVRNGANELVRFEVGSGTTRVIQLPSQGSVNVQSADSSGQVGFKLSTHTRETDTYTYNPNTGEVRLLQEGERPDVALDATFVLYTPYEGWTVPIWVVKRQDVQFSPETPMYLYGYGGFRYNLLPNYDGTYLPWLRRGGAVAFVILPGGLEYGEAWHRLGMLENKRNVFDAFAQAAKTLINKGWTKPQRIAIGGTSNGGLLAAATAHYYPALFRATVPQVGVLDMTRFALFTGGANWIQEYGNRDNAGDFRNLISISPYHNLRRGMRYPATLVVTCDQDDRVVPAHSYKFVARLQAASPGVQALLHVAHGTGHGVFWAAPEENVRTASIIWSFVMGELGMN